MLAFVLDDSLLPLGELSDRLTRDLLAEYSLDQALTNQEAKVVLQRTFAVVESTMAQICQKYSKFLLLLLLREKIPPQGLTSESDTPSLDLRPLQILTFAALKYGDNSVEFRFRSIVSGAKIHITKEEVNDAIRLFELAVYYSYLMKLWKAHGSGGEIQIRDGKLTPAYGQQVHALGQLENRRLERNWRNVLSSSSMIGMLSEQPQMGSSRLLLALPIIGNPEKKASDGEPDIFYWPEFYGERRFNIHYTMNHYDAASYADLVRPYSRFVVEEYGLSLDELLLCLVSMGHVQLTLQMRSADAFEGALLTGIGIYPVDRLRSVLHRAIRTFSRAFNVCTNPVILARRFFKAMVLPPDKYHLLDLHGGWASSIIYRFEDYALVDWTTMPALLLNIAHVCSSRTEMANIKGDQYEIELDKWITGRVHGTERLFQPNMKLRYEGVLYGEVDLSFRQGNVGYIVECKAYSVSKECLRGDKDALNTRWSYGEDWLSQVITTTQKLSQQPHGDNYQILSEVEYLVPVVCSPNVGPVYDIDAKYFVAPELPRICTPLELADLITMEHTSSVYSNQYTFSVHHG